MQVLAVRRDSDLRPGGMEVQGGVPRPSAPRRTEENEMSETGERRRRSEEDVRPEPRSPVEGTPDETTEEISVPDYVVRDFDPDGRELTEDEDEGPGS